MEYKNDIFNIKKKIDYIKERLNRNIPIKEHEKLEMTLINI